MTSGAQQLAADFEQVKSLLDRFPDIRLLETEGNPPERYDIEYRVKGYKQNEDGTATPASSHIVRITLPFGYPHFPPTAKPLTSIFHPDIDSDAIRIADFWEENTSLAELIVHIGKMICGTFYQKEEPFNQDAFDWYEKRRDWLPFDILEPAGAEDQDHPGDDPAAESEGAQELPTPGEKFSPEESLDILKDELTLPFDEDEPEDMESALFAAGLEQEEDDLTSLLDLEKEDQPGSDDTGGGDEAIVDLTGDGGDPSVLPDEDMQQGPPGGDEDDGKISPDFEIETDMENELLGLLDEEEVGPGSAGTGGDKAIVDLTGDDGDLPAFPGEDVQQEPPGGDEDDGKISPEFEIETDTEDELLGLLDEEEVGSGSAGTGGDEAIVDLTGDGGDLSAFPGEDVQQGPPGGDEDMFLEAPAGMDAEDSFFTVESEGGGEISPDFKREAEAEYEPLGMLNEEDAGQAGEQEKIEEDDIPMTIEDFSSEKADTSSDKEIPPESIGREEKADGGASVEDQSIARLELDDEVPAAEPKSGRESGKVRSIRPLVEQKKFFSANKLLADIPDPSSIPDLEELEQQITGAVTKAEELFKKADKLERKGELEKAGLTLDLIANVAVDYPGLEFARNRIRDSLLAKDSRQNADNIASEGALEETVSGKKKTAKPGFRIPYRIIAIVIVLIGILAAATLVTIRDSANIKLAYSNFKQAEQLLENKEYKQAEKALQHAASALDEIIALQKDEQVKLREKIAAIFDTQSFKEGLQGRVFYDGRYVTVDTAKNIDRFNSLMLDAETHQNSGNIDEALKLYAQAGETAGQIGFEDQEKTIRQTINSLRLKKALGEARKAEEEQEWKQAADTYAKALELSGSFSTPDNTNEIAARLAAASFRHELMEGQRAFTASEWQKTIEMLQRAQKILENNPQIATEGEKAEISRLLINSRLFHILSSARNAFEKQEWELAINQYKNATYLLENNKKVLGDKADDSIVKIEKTILMTEIAREQSRNSAAVANNNLQESLGSYRTIVSTIENSAFGEDETLRKILEDARKQIAVLENDLRINSRVDWLKQNYEDIFRKMYPSAKSSELLNPQVTFIREEGEKLIFTMSCVEKKQGRSFRLELNYQYDQERNSWDIYSGEL